jgi:hypothetical protein
MRSDAKRISANATANRFRISRRKTAAQALRVLQMRS